MNTPQPNQSFLSPRCRGFTILELLVAIAIIVTLVALVAVGVGRFRASAVGTRDMASLRSHAQSFSAYAADHKGGLPLFLSPGLGSNTLVMSDGFEVRQISYFDAFQTWHLVLGGTGYAAPAANDPVYFPEGFDTSQMTRHTPFAYPCAFVADPAYWNPKTRLGPELVDPLLQNQYRGTRLGEVRYPGAKTLLVQTWSQENNGSSRPPDPAQIRTRVVTVDGAGHSLTPLDIVPGHFSGDGFAYRDFGAVHYRDTPRMLHTSDGVRGRDLK